LKIFFHSSPDIDGSCLWLDEKTWLLSCKNWSSKAKAAYKSQEKWADKAYKPHRPVQG